MPKVKAMDIGFVRFRAPDLDKMERFLKDFGMETASRTEQRLFMRGHDGAPFIHVTELGDPGFDGLSFEIGSTVDLERLAEKTGTAIVEIDGPGGGQSVILKDPDGFRVEATCRELGSATPLRGPAPINRGFDKPRQNDVSRIKESPAEIVRLGHCVLNVTDFRVSEAWYKDHFGLITSDEIEVGPGQVLGAFLRCDQGSRPVDHHTLFLVGTGEPSFNHAAFEVDDYNSLMAGHHHLKAREYCPHWGVGRHILGSQIFDYWKDPWGHVLEHWTDGDLFDSSSPPNRASLDVLMGTQWGPGSPKHNG